MEAKIFDGFICKVVPSTGTSGGFGFIRTPESANDVFYHFLALDGMAFNEQLLERRVRFTVETTPRGRRAKLVWPAE